MTISNFFIFILFPHIREQYLSKIFEVINLSKDTSLSKEEKEKTVNKLMGTPGSKVREEYNQKYLNILKLQQNGTL